MQLEIQGQQAKEQPGFGWLIKSVGSTEITE